MKNTQHIGTTIESILLIMDRKYTNLVEDIICRSEVVENVPDPHHATQSSSKARGQRILTMHAVSTSQQKSNP